MSQHFTRCPDLDLDQTCDALTRKDLQFWTSRRQPDATVEGCTCILCDHEDIGFSPDVGYPNSDVAGPQDR